MAFTVHVENFQSLLDVTVEVDGFTVITGTNNSGKALKNGTRVATPNGWRPVELLRIGDLVIAGDGLPSRVVGVFPQGLRPTWQVTFDDGRQVVVDGEHLWKVSFGNCRFPRSGGKQRWQVLSTLQIVASVGEKPIGQKRPAIPMAGPAEYHPQDIPIDPYLVGLLIGDGCLGATTPRFTSADPEIIESISAILPPCIHVVKSGRYDYRLSGLHKGRGHTNPLTKSCLDLGISVHAQHKFVPDVYKYNTCDIRLAVLQGLMDTDGSAGNKQGRTYFYTTSSRLANDVSEIVWSLGGKVRRTLKHPTYPVRGERRKGLLCHVLCIRLTTFPLFRLKRKLDRVLVPMRRNDPLMVSITPSDDAHCTCIAVDHPDHLFQIDGYLVTHNSALMRAIRGAFQNAKGTSYIRHGKTKAVVEVSFADGHKVRWEKGKDKGDKPTFIIDDGKPLYPGQAVPDEVRALGVRPIMAGGKEIWPQFAPQFTGQVFLLDQPGSVLAEAVSDVNRVSQLNEALRLAESDRRAATSELRIRLNDQVTLDAEVLKYVGLDDVTATVEAIEADIAKANKVAQALQVFVSLKGKLTVAQNAVQNLEGVDAVDVPGDEPFKALKDNLVELAALESLSVRMGQAKAAVQKYADLPEGVVLETAVAEKCLTSLTTAEGLRSKLTAATKEVESLESQLQTAESDLPQVDQEITTVLGGLGECPLCGSVMEHGHV